MGPPTLSPSVGEASITFVLRLHAQVSPALRTILRSIRSWTFVLSETFRAQHNSTFAIITSATGPSGSTLPFFLFRSNVEVIDDGLPEGCCGKRRTLVFFPL